MRVQLTRLGCRARESLVVVVVGGIATFGGSARGQGAPSQPRSASANHDVVVRGSAETTAYADTDHVTVFTPNVAVSAENPLQGWKIGGSYLVDVISAASVDIVSTASRRWQEVRQAGTAAASYARGDVTVRATGALSSEPDYHADAIGGDVSLDLDQKNVTPFFGYAYGHDLIGRAGTSFDVYSHTVSKNRFTAGVNFVMNRSTLISIIGDSYFERGDSSKPYRYIPLFDPAVAAALPRGASIDEVNAKRRPERPLEQLPLARDRYAMSFRLARRFDASTLRVDERLYADTWGLKAVTLDVRDILDLSRRWTLGPHLRWHGQGAVDFWRRAYTVTSAVDGSTVPRLRTGDRELGPLWTTTVGSELGWALGPSDDLSAWTLRLVADWMHSRYLDDLYVTSRDAGFTALSLDGVFQ